MAEARGEPNRRVFEGPLGDSSLESYLAATERAAEAEIGLNDLVMRNHLRSSTQVIANLEALRAADLRPVELLAALASDPTSPAQTQGGES